MRPPNFTKTVVVSGDWHFEKSQVTVDGQLLAKSIVHGRFLDYVTYWGPPLLLVYAGDSFETRPMALERLAQERLAQKNSSMESWDVENELRKLEAEREAIVQVVTDQLAECELLDISVFLSGNHDSTEGLYKLLGHYDVQILSYARIPMQATTALIRHGAWSGMEQAAANAQKDLAGTSRPNQEEKREQRYGTAILRRAKEVLMKEITGLGFRVPPEWWVVLGHYASPVANQEHRVAGLSNWEGELSGPFGRRIIQIDPQEDNGVSVVKVPKDWLRS